MARVAIAAGSQIAADAGAAAAANGGNAVDAAIAASIASMCTDPGIIALGGGSFIVIWPPDEDPLVVDAYAEMPGREAPPERFGTGAEEVYMAYGGGMTTIVGHGSVAAPGAVAGFGVSSRSFGSLPWPALFEPTLYWAERGFPLSGAAAEYMTYAHEVIFGWHAESYRILHHPDGSHVQEGEIVKIAGLTESLQLLAAEGPDCFYSGELGRRLAEDNWANGGLITMADLDAYEAVLRDPLQIELGDWRLATNPPPAIGGAAVAAVLLLARDVDGWEGWSTFAEALHAVISFRRNHWEVGDDRFGEAQRLLELAELGDYRGLLTAPSTIHVSTVDESGLACSITTSAGYGSGAMIPGSGIWLNNSLGETELHPRGFHALEPSTRLPSNMAPTIARNTGGAVLAVGSPGADRITSAIAQTLFNYLRLGLPLEEAVSHPRLHAEIFEGRPTIAYEPGLPVTEKEGFSLRPFSAKSMYFGGLSAALFDPETGLQAAADPRRAGGTAVGG